MRWPLRNQMFVPFSVLMMAVLLVVSLINSYLAAERASRQIEQQLDRVAEVMRRSSFPLTDAVLQQAGALSGATFVLIDAKGTILSAPGLEPSESLRRLAAETNSSEGRFQVETRRFFRRTVALGGRADSANGGHLHVLYDEGARTDAWRQAAVPPLVIGALAVTLVGLVARVLAGRLSRPIVDLQASFARLTSGHFEPLPLPPRNDEIRDLVLSTNQLVGELNSLREAVKRAERLALLGQLSGGLAHHLRNAITGAKLALQLHQRHCTADEPRIAAHSQTQAPRRGEGSLDVALRQLALTEDYLQRLLSVGQPQAPRREPCDLRAQVDDVAQLLAPTARHRKVALTIEPAEPTPMRLVADAVQLRQVLVNLMVNAIEAAGSDGWVRVTLSEAPDGTRVVRVVDSGPGPPDAIRPHLFEPFTTGKPEGVGLGLAVARQVARQHGGSLTLTAETREEAAEAATHTCFQLTLPGPSEPSEPA